MIGQEDDIALKMKEANLMPKISKAAFAYHFKSATISNAKGNERENLALFHPELVNENNKDRKRFLRNNISENITSDMKRFLRKSLALRTSAHRKLNGNEGFELKSIIMKNSSLYLENDSLDVLKKYQELYKIYGSLKIKTNFELFDVLPQSPYATNPKIVIAFAISGFLFFTLYFTTYNIDIKYKI
jgi:hypothetical protein